MAGNPNWGELMTTTMAHRRKTTADAISRNNILLYELRRRKRVKSLAGGRTITTPIMVGEENENFQWYTGREGLNVAGQEVMTSAEFPWKQYACGVSISGLEMLQNSGEAQVLDMMAKRIEHAEKTIQNQMHKSAHGDGTSYSGKEFGGMQLLVSAVPGRTVGGINSTTYGWWDNKRATTGGPTTANIYDDMLDLKLEVCRGTDMANLIVSDNTYYSTFSKALQGQQRFSEKSLVSAGFSNIMFEEIPVVPDGCQGGYAPVGMRFLNLMTIELKMHSKRNNTILSGPRRPLTEDSETVIIAGMGNFLIDNRMLNGVLST